MRHTLKFHSAGKRVHSEVKNIDLLMICKIRIVSRSPPDACELPLDLNTAHRLLTLSQENRKVTWLEEQPYPDHPERFEQREMVLCREALSGRCYWEAEWSFRSYMGMTYKGINRNKGDDDGVLGSNDMSWSLHCSGKSYSASHNKSATDIPFPSSGSHKVGVCLDWPGRHSVLLQCHL
ncbi:unnamed protein product [Oncorhynchus mykiss]|uniref:B30.2/SPRY domain-containing protein n=1 Tax=Oncorhynchus mykiss TaxID=8022 RepID=A0A060Z6Y7_ONCMY|nr:unnamed protein product [Oncorhynchus mykiss]